MKRKKNHMWILCICCFAIFYYWYHETSIKSENKYSNSHIDYKVDNEDILSTVPEFTEEAYVIINDNIPYFTEEEKVCKNIFEEYSDLDELGRCGVAYANICKELMPTQERGTIGHVKPSGWHLIKYDIIDGRYLYNRCHLIGYQLAGENANEKNLITGTRFLNVSGMLQFENLVYDYVKKTDNHVLYRVTPVFNENDLIATGVLIEAYSVEDEGLGICFNVFIYNSQPGIEIDYSTGDSWLIEEEIDASDKKMMISPEASLEEKLGKESSEKSTGCNIYILNTNTKKFHLPECNSVTEMKEKNKKEVRDSRDNIIMDGYFPCKRCNP